MPSRPLRRDSRDGRCCVVTSGGDQPGVAECRQGSQRAMELTNIGSRTHQRRRRVYVQSSGLENFRTPGMVFYTQQLGMGRVGVFGNSPSAQTGATETQAN